MTAPTYTLPTVGNPNSTEDPLVRTALSDLKTLLTDGIDDSNLATSGVGAGSIASDAVTTAKILDANVTTAKLAGSITGSKLSAATVADSNLVSPNNVTYKTIMSAAAYAGSQGVSTSYATVTGVLTNGGTILSSVVPAEVFDYTTGDYAVGSLTTNFRVKMQVFVGGTSPSTVTFNAGLYPLTISAGTMGLGTVVTGSQTGTTATPTLATNTTSRYASSDFAASALTTTTTYVLAVIIGSITVPINIALASQLQVRNT